MTVVIKGLQKWEVIGLKASYRENVTVLPAEHGRLIDSSAIGLTDFEIVMCDGNYKEVLKMLLEKIERAPTIIEAEVSDGKG